jgi:hypothetical protein
VTYGVKMAGVTYGVKMAQESEARQLAYLKANGGRLVHASRGWWRNGDGQACGQRDAMAAWRRLRGDDSDARWILCREDL